MNYSITVHWNRIVNKWSVHYRGACHLLEQIKILTPVETVYKPNKKHNPRAFLKTKGILEGNIIKAEGTDLEHPVNSNHERPV